MNHLLAYQRLHFYLGNVARFFSIPWLQQHIAPSEATTIFGCAFGSDGWHPLIRTLAEYDHDNEIHWRNTSIYRYLMHFTPKGICDFFENKNLNCKLPLFVYPWGTFRVNEYASKKDPSLSRFCGPSSEDFIKNEFYALIRLYREIMVNGYKPWRYGNGFIRGTFLYRKDGSRKFIVLQGNHRLAILSHLGWPKIAVRYCRGHLRSVREIEIAEFPMVKKGYCSVESAKKIFGLFFSENGAHILNLLDSKISHSANVC